jgi:YHS domain-containing protein
MQKLRPQAGNTPTLSNRLISGEGILSTDETNITETSATKRFHTLCKRVFRTDSNYFPSAEYRGKTIYFCTETCLDAFLADPERFYCAHSQPASRK